MIIEDLDIVKRLIAEKEGGLVEFKETTGQLERGMETLCAFLNGNGGTVLFGVNDKGKIIGQDVSDKTRRDIADAINRLEPVAMVQISYAPLPDSEKKVIIFRVEDSRLINLEVPGSSPGWSTKKIKELRISQLLFSCLCVNNA